ncbi:MAG: YkgJ family cysteine cluster protein [Dehalogenimonas sp.]
MDIIDFDKHGLSNLKGRRPHLWTPAELDSFLEACAADEAAPRINIPFSFDTIQTLLSLARCRGCGRCCIPNPRHPEWPGAGLFEDELKEVAKGSLIPFNKLKQQCIYRDAVDGRKSYWLPFPCQFRSPKGCKVYQVRPMACRMYPFVAGDNDPSHLIIKVSCEYGKDIYRAVMQNIRESLVDTRYLASDRKKFDQKDSDWDYLVEKLPKNV